VAAQIGGEHVDCDAVVVARGTVPRDGLAARARLQVDGGVLVDARLRTSDPHVLAAGDVARAPVPGHGRLRLEGRAGALCHGALAGRSLQRLDVRLEAVPARTSELYGVAFELHGRPGPLDDLIVRGDPGLARFIAFWHHERLVSAALAVGIADAGDELERIVRTATRIDLRRLADPDTPLSEVYEVLPDASRSG
jgi:3-phenylpropionate/trans-cinnamate dioxygenase ferredoxin reductase component